MITKIELKCLEYLTILRDEKEQELFNIENKDNFDLQKARKTREIIEKINELIKLI